MADGSVLVARPTNLLARTLSHRCPSPSPAAPCVLPVGPPAPRPLVAAAPLPSAPSATPSPPPASRPDEHRAPEEAEPEPAEAEDAEDAYSQRLEAALAEAEAEADHLDGDGDGDLDLDYDEDDYELERRGRGARLRRRREQEAARGPASPLAHEIGRVLGPPRRRGCSAYWMKAADLRRVERKASARAAVLSSACPSLAPPPRPIYYSPPPSSSVPFSSGSPAPRPAPCTPARSSAPARAAAAASSREEQELARAIEASLAVHPPAAGGLSAAQLRDLLTRELRPEDYELLCQLDATVKPRTADPAALAALPQRPAAPADVEARLACTVCQMEVEVGEALLTLPCRHAFHAPCVTGWLSTAGHRCPNCGLSLRD